MSRLLLLVFGAASLLSCTPEAPDTQALRERARNLLQLETCEFVYRDLLYRGIDDTVIGLTTRRTRMLAEINIHVIAGIDVKKGLELSTKGYPGQADSEITIQIPPAEILLVDADEQSIKQFFLQEFGFLSEGKLSLLEFQDQLKKNKDDATNDAVRRGILERAFSNAQGILKNLFSLAGFARVEVRALELVTGVTGQASPSGSVGPAGTSSQPVLPSEVQP